MSQGSQTSRPFRRTAMVTAAAALVTMAALLAPGGAGAQEPEDDFVAGSGRSTAKFARVGPTRAQLVLAPSLGVSLADYLNTVARAESLMVHYAALDDTVPEELRDQTPPVKVTSTDEDAEGGTSESFAGAPEGFPVDVGTMRQSARADDTPFGESVFRSGGFSIADVVEVGAGVARSTAGLLGDEGTREARGVVTMSDVSIAGGVVVLEGLRWEAVQRSGARGAEQGSFTVGGIEIAGQPVGVPEGGADLTGFLGDVNDALAPVGLVILAPEDTSGDGVGRIGSLTIRISDSELGKTLLGPVLEAAQPVREPLAEALIEGSDGEVSPAILVADILLGVASGASDMHIELGGASAFTEGERFDNPLDGFALPTDRVIPPETVTEVLPGSGARPGEPATPQTAPAPAAPTSEDTGALGTVASGRTVPGERGVGFAVGLVGIAAALGMAAADWRRMRRAVAPAEAAGR